MNENPANIDIALLQAAQDRAMENGIAWLNESDIATQKTVWDCIQVDAENPLEELLLNLAEIGMTALVLEKSRRLRGGE